MSIRAKLRDNPKWLIKNYILKNIFFHSNDAFAIPQIVKKSIVEVIHPTSLKNCRAGHPWITLDEHSAEFSKNADLLEIVPLNDIFINDPTHPKIKARYWGKSDIPFDMDIEFRLSEAILKRSEIVDRENVFLCFGEVDSLPGMYVLKLGDVILIQYQAYFWNKHIGIIVDFIKRRFKEIKSIYKQSRLYGSVKVTPKKVWGETNSNLIIDEFGIKYNVFLEDYHDVGIYTDMSSIRKKLFPYYSKSKNVLNLFSYTGAFSLLGLKNALEVTSVDISSKFMSILESNIQLNSFDEDKHTSVVKPVDKFLKNNDQLFDLIICDPPSFSSNKKKSQSAISFYKENLNTLMNMLSPQGRLIMFLNTHKISRSKFKRSLPRGLKIEKELFTGRDCPLLKGFPEGDYLKGYIVFNG